MGFEDRDYYRDQPASTGLGRVGQWLLFGRVPLFTAFGIRVHAHAMLIITMGLMLLFMGRGFVWQDRLIASLGLFVIVLLHEFGHCFGCRAVGGSADEIVMHPLGGLALCQPPHRWWPSFVTTACGPLVNVAICIVSGAVLYLYSGRIPWRPFYIEPFEPFSGWGDIAWWCYWIYQSSWTLLLFNLLPIFPLDGGRMTQEVLWKFVGYYRSMLLSCNVGMVAAVIGLMVGVATMSFFFIILCVLGLMYCLQMKRSLREAGPYAFEDEADFSAAHEPWKQQDARESREREKERKREAKLEKIAQRAAQAQAADEQRLDELLAKISASGKDSLTRSEKRFLEHMSETKRSKPVPRPSVRR